MLELAVQLGTVKGKKSYGYLPKRLKNLVDEMERLPVVSKCYNQGCTPLRSTEAATPCTFWSRKPQRGAHPKGYRKSGGVVHQVGGERKSLRLVPPEPSGGELSFLCDTGSHPAAPPHEPDIPGQLCSQVLLRRHSD